MDIGIMIIFTILILFGLSLTFSIGKKIGKIQTEKLAYAIIQKEKKKSIERSRAILKGQFSEQLSPFNKDFPANPSECKFLGAPIDFISFKGLDEKNVTEIIFIEIKTGSSNLNQTEKSIKNTIENKKVVFKEFRI